MHIEICKIWNILCPKLFEKHHWTHQNGEDEQSTKASGILIVASGCSTRPQSPQSFHRLRHTASLFQLRHQSSSTVSTIHPSVRRTQTASLHPSPSWPTTNSTWWAKSSWRTRSPWRQRSPIWSAFLQYVEGGRSTSSPPCSATSTSSAAVSRRTVPTGSFRTLPPSCSRTLAGFTGSSRAGSAPSLYARWFRLATSSQPNMERLPTRFWPPTPAGGLSTALEQPTRGWLWRWLTRSWPATSRNPSPRPSRQTAAVRGNVPSPVPLPVAYAPVPALLATPARTSCQPSPVAAVAAAPTAAEAAALAVEAGTRTSTTKSSAAPVTTLATLGATLTTRAGAATVAPHPLAATGAATAPVPAPVVADATAATNRLNFATPMSCIFVFIVKKKYS